MTNDQPHRPPKYVDGHYKPHYGDPDADYAIYIWPFDPNREPHLATTDPDGDAKGVVRNLDGKPLNEGGSTIVGHIHNNDIRLREFWENKIDTETIEEKLP